MGPDDVAAVLGETSLFRVLDHDDLVRVAGSCLQRAYRRGQFLCQQGDPGDRLFVIASGLVKVVLTAEQGDELVLATLRRPEVFGEVAVLDQGPRSASVVAVNQSDVLLLSRSTLLELFRSYPALTDVFLVALGGMLRRLTEQAGDLVFLDLTGRLAKLLLRLAQEHGIDAADGALALRLSQSELAAMVGASRPAVNRVLQALAARGIIDVSGQTISLRDIQALRRRTLG
jgi:CRP/FNR family cyclic AMP-dependent transcriptional regulator